MAKLEGKSLIIGRWYQVAAEDCCLQTYFKGRFCGKEIDDAGDVMGYVFNNGGESILINGDSIDTRPWFEEIQVYEP